MPPASASRARSSPAGSSTESAARVGDDALDEAGQHAAGPDLHEAIGALGGEPLTHAVHRTGLAIWRSRNGTTSAAAG